MDEWTGALNKAAFEALLGAFRATLGRVEEVPWTR
jgi:hypothetical protein